MIDFPSMTFRSELDPATRKELELFYAQLEGLFRAFGFTRNGEFLELTIKRKNATGAVAGSRIIVRENAGGTGAAGTLVLYAKDGTPYYLWVDTTGDLRVHTSAPTENESVSDTAGTVVGTQT